MNICPYLKNRKVKALFDELVSKFGKNLAFFIWDKSNGLGLDLAPNGALSILFNDLVEFYKGDREEAMKAKIKSLETKIKDAQLDKNGEYEVGDVICMQHGCGKKETSHNQTKYISKLLQRLGCNVIPNRNHSFNGGCVNMDTFTKRTKEELDEYEKSVLNNLFDKARKFFKKTPIVEYTKDRYGNYEYWISGYRPILTGYDDDAMDWSNRYAEDVIVPFLQQRLPDVKYQWHTEAEAVQILGNGNKDAWYDVETNTVHLIVGKSMTDSVFEEFMHALVLSLANDNLALFNSLLEDAKKEFPDIVRSVKKEYKDSDEFTLNNEIIAKSLSRVLDLQHTNKSKTSLTAQGLLRKFTLWFASLIQNALHALGYGDYAIDNSKLPKMTVQELSDLICCRNVRFSTYTARQQSLFIKGGKLYNMSKTQDSEELHNRIITALLLLHGVLERRSKRSAGQERFMNNIHDTIANMRNADIIIQIGQLFDLAKGNIGLYKTDNAGRTIDKMYPSDYDPNNPSSPHSMWGILLEASKNDFLNLSPIMVTDQYRNVINFYDLLFSQIDGFLHGEVNGVKTIVLYVPNEQDRRELLDRFYELRDILRECKELWKKAVYTIGDNIIDKSVDEFVTAEKLDRESMKVVYKDWLHKNLYYGDINGTSSWMWNFGQSPNPIVKMAFHIISHALSKTQWDSTQEAARLDNMFSKANGIMKQSLPGVWQQLLMETDRRGLPTGRFVRDRNYGLYEQDLNEFIRDLNDRFDRGEFGYGNGDTSTPITWHYEEDELGNLVRSDTKLPAEEEEWGTTGDVKNDMPACFKYILAKEKWISEHAHRRYTYDYYEERLTRPIDNSATPNSIAIDLPHGLSPRTYFKYNKYQELVNYILDKCIDKKTGFARPEELDLEDRIKLEDAYLALQELQNPYYPDGTIKQDEDFETAIELISWLTWSGKYMSTQVDHDAFDEAYNELANDPNTTKDKIDAFIKFNTTYGIHPEYGEGGWLGELQYIHTWEYKLRRQGLLRLAKGEDDLFLELLLFANNPLFFIKCRECDLYIDTHRKHSPKHIRDSYEASYHLQLIPWRDSYGMYLGKNGGIVLPNLYWLSYYSDDATIEVVSFYDWLLDNWTNKALTDGKIDGLVNSQTGALIDFTGWSDLQIRSFLEKNIFTYTHVGFDKLGRPFTEDRKLSCFSVQTPNVEEFTAKDGSILKTITRYPTRRFSSKTSNRFVDPMYDPHLNESTLPRRFDENGKVMYDNSEAFNKLGGKDSDVYKFYEALVETMRYHYMRVEPNATKYDYRLPQINADNSQILSRIFQFDDKSQYAKIIAGGVAGAAVGAVAGNFIGGPFGAAVGGWYGMKLGAATSSKKTKDILTESLVNVQENDEEMRTSQSYITNIDGTKSLTLPKRYVTKLDDPSTISKDLISTVKLFVYMANNYENMSKIEGDIQVLIANMEDEVRNSAINNNLHGYVSAKNSLQVMKSLANLLLYDSKYDENPNDPSSVFIAKAGRAIMRSSSLMMLGFNCNSIATGAFLLGLRVFTDAFTNRLYNVHDWLISFFDVLRVTPAIIANIGKSRNSMNVRLIAFMKSFGVGRSFMLSNKDTNLGLIRKLWNSLLMGGYSFFDYWGNCFLLRAMLNHRRFYDGDKVPKGFYTEYELINKLIDTGMSPSEAKKEAIGSRMFSHHTLWGAFRCVKGELVPKPEYAPYIDFNKLSTTRRGALLFGALAAGVNPDNDTSMSRTKFWGLLMLAMRGWLTMSLQFSGWSQFVGTTTTADETTVPMFVSNPTQYINHGVTRSVDNIVKLKRTKELISRRMTWNWETGRPTDEMLIAVGRSIGRIFKAVGDLFTFNFKSLKQRLSYVEKKAWRSLLVRLASITFTAIMVPIAIDLARETPAPISYSESTKKLKPYQTRDAKEARRQSSAWTPFELEYYQQLIWKMQLADWTFRTYQGQLDEIDITAAYDILSALTTLSSGVDNWYTAVYGLGADATGLSGHSLDEVITDANAYKNWTRGEKYKQIIVPGARNFHSSFSYHGLLSNLKWYTLKYGDRFKYMGMDLSIKPNFSRFKSTSSGFGDFLNVRNDFSGASNDFSGSRNDFDGARNDFQ